MKAFFEKEISIRLADEGGKFVCTTKYGKFFSRTTEVSLSQPKPEAIEDPAMISVKKRSLYGLSEEE